jgi:uncharacterized protein YyaL (SSP411 family)
MRTSIQLLFFAAAVLGGAGEAPAPPGGAALTWLPWSSDLFVRAQAEHRLVLLDLEAVWCHWCHVMDETTYRDGEVAALLERRFLVVRVDQDARPDLANRYEDYGWPATIVFDGSGRELVKRSGYLPPRAMAGLLQAIIDDPTPGPSVEPEAPLVPAAAGALDAQRRRRLEDDLLASYDPVQAGWGRRHKYLDADCLEHALLHSAGAGAPAAAAGQRARASLDAARALFDPAWGGVYQYSTGGVWCEPHFEKLLTFQADYLRSYALAYAGAGRLDDLHACTQLVGYVAGFLTSPEGAFYASQDADLVAGEHAGEYFAGDDAHRRALGLPRVDRHLYARENGAMISALCASAAACGDRAARSAAERAARWIIDHRSLPGGGFSHDAQDAAGPYLGDTLMMARAALALYALTAERRWLGVACRGLDFIAAHFAPVAAAAGYLTVPAIPAGLPATASRDENILLARTANLAGRYAGAPAYHAMAERALRFVLAAGVAERRPTAGVLIAADEVPSEPLQLTVVGGKDDARAAALFAAAAADPCVYKTVEWDDAREGALPSGASPASPGVPLLLICRSGRCSAPVTDPAQVRAQIDRALARAPR